MKVAARICSGCNQPNWPAGSSSPRPICSLLAVQACCLSPLLLKLRSHTASFPEQTQQSDRLTGFLTEWKESLKWRDIKLVFVDVIFLFQLVWVHLQIPACFVLLCWGRVVVSPTELAFWRAGQRHCTRLKDDLEIRKRKRIYITARVNQGKF